MNYFRFVLSVISIGSILYAARGTSKEQLFYDAVRLESTGDITNAIQKYEEALSQASSANLHGNLANLYYLNNDYGRSILHYKKALLLEPINRDFRSNLAYVEKIANVRTAGNNESISKNRISNDFWKGLLAAFFWSGLLIISILFFQRVKNQTIIVVSFCWITVNLLFVFLIYKSSEEIDLLERTVVAINSINLSENNSSSSLKLRKFAATTSSANSTARLGETLIVDKAETGELQSHQSQGIETWLLVSTSDKRSRGWVLEKEIGWLTRN